uniref:Serpentine Receptor, class T n=1 Tax=Ditylenchus dipsaci TaxID=166011 RepID=A0A915DKS2_9BILA
MNMFLFRRDQFNLLYNCTNIHIEDVPFENRRHVTEAIITICLCAFYYILYIPCMLSIWKHRENACYKLLLYISITDLAILWLLGFVHGILSLIGAVYCSYPTFIYLAGVAVTAIWAAESVAEITLSINRCISILSPHTEKALFGGWKVYIWLFFTSCYAMYWAFCIKPVLFTGLHFSWFFNPYVGYIEDINGTYENFTHTVHDIGMAIAIPSIYGIFFIAFTIKTRALGGSQEKGISSKQKMMFLQIFVISSLNMVACSIYVYMGYVSINEGLIHVGEFCWFHIHGFPPVIYLTLNKTIRDDCKRMLKGLLEHGLAKKQLKIFFSDTSRVRPSNNNSSTL